MYCVVTTWVTYVRPVTLSITNTCTSSAILLLLNYYTVQHDVDKGITKIARSRAFKSISLRSLYYANSLSSVQLRHVMPKFRSELVAQNVLSSWRLPIVTS